MMSAGPPSNVDSPWYNTAEAVSTSTDSTPFGCGGTTRLATFAMSSKEYSPHGSVTSRPSPPVGSATSSPGVSGAVKHFPRQGKAPAVNKTRRQSNCTCDDQNIDLPMRWIDVALSIAWGRQPAAQESSGGGVRKESGKSVGAAA